MKAFLMIASAFALSATTAAAQDLSSAPAERISFADLDLGSTAGKAALQQRIRAAASRVCDTESGEQSLQENLAGKVCYKSSVAGALHQMDQVIAAGRPGPVMAAAIVVVGIR